jgi:hypothetical protein
MIVTRPNRPEEMQRLEAWLRANWPKDGWTATMAWQAAKRSLGTARRQSVINAGVATGKTWPNGEKEEDLAPCVDVKDQELQRPQSLVGLPASPSGEISAVGARRTSLKELGYGDRHKFFATVDRFGTKKGFKGRGTPPTICLKNIICNNKVVADHQWFTCGVGFAGLMSCDRISFHARVTSYEKGYQGRRDDIIDRPIRHDWKLSRPTRITLEHESSDAEPAASSKR